MTSEYLTATEALRRLADLADTLMVAHRDTGMASSCWLDYAEAVRLAARALTAHCGHVIAATYGGKCQLPICAGDREAAAKREAR